MDDGPDDGACYADDMDASIFDPALFDAGGSDSPPERMENAYTDRRYYGGYGSCLRCDQSFFQCTLSDGSFLYGVDQSLL